MKNKYFTFIMLFFIGLFQTFGQILNVDRENNEDSIKKKVKGILAFNFSSDKQKSNLLEFQNKNELDFFLNKDHVIIVLSQVDYSFNGAKNLENNGFLMARFRDNDTRVIYPDLFYQYQWNGVLGMQNRNVAGMNIRINCMEKKKSDLYTSIGVFYEAERWNPFLSTFSYFNDSLQIVNRNMFRLNTMLKTAFKIGKSIDFSAVSYVQFPLNKRFNSPRWFFDSNLIFESSKHLSFVIHYDHNLDFFRPLPIDTYYYNLSMGIQVKI